VIGPHVGAAAAIAARLSDLMGLGTATLVWDVDLIAQPLADDQWRALLERFKAKLHDLPSGGVPIRIRLTHQVGGYPVQTTIRLPLPDVSAHFPTLVAAPPPVGRWRLEALNGPVVSEHQGSADALDFCQDMPF